MSSVSKSVATEGSPKVEQYRNAGPKSEGEEALGLAELHAAQRALARADLGSRGRGTAGTLPSPIPRTSRVDFSKGEAKNASPLAAIGVPAAGASARIDRTQASSSNLPITVKDAARFLGVSPQTVYLWVERKQIPHLRVMGRNIRFLKSDLEPFRAQFKQEVENWQDR